MASNNKRQRPARARKGEPAADARQAARPAQTTREGEPPGEPAPVPAPQEARPTRMTKVQLERRVHALEAQIAWLKAELEEVRGPQIPWWEKISGSFANDPEFEEAMRLGREWRESFRPKKRSPKKKSRKAKSSDGFLIPIT